LPIYYSGRFIKNEMKTDQKPVYLWILDGAAVSLVAAALIVIFISRRRMQSWVRCRKCFISTFAAGWQECWAFWWQPSQPCCTLTRKDNRWDALSVCAVEIGLLFSLITTFSGMIWARPIWGTWWTWDARLTTMTIMDLLYLAYFILRGGIDDPENAAGFQPHMQSWGSSVFL